MSRQQFNYNQYVIGDCGHSCQVWPQVSGIGGVDPEVICETCTREQYGIPDSEQLSVWVRIKSETPQKQSAKPRKKKAVSKSVWDDLMPTQQVLLDGT